MWSRNGKVWSPGKNVKSKLPTHLSLEFPVDTVSHAEI